MLCIASSVITHQHNNIIDNRYTLNHFSFSTLAPLSRCDKYLRYFSILSDSSANNPIPTTEIIYLQDDRAEKTKRPESAESSRERCMAVP